MRLAKTPTRRPLANHLRAGLLALMLPAAALFATPALAADAAKVDQLMLVLQLDKQIGQMHQMIEQVMEQSFVEGARQRGLTDAQIAELRPQIERMKVGMREMMSWEALAPEYRKIYIDVLSNEEVDAAIAYYQSPAGKSMMEKMPQLMQRGMEVGQRRAQEVMPRVMEEMKRTVEGAAPAAPAAPTAPAAPVPPAGD